DRQLRRLLVDEAVARLALLEQAVPGRADVARVAVGDDGRIARPAPAHDVALDRALRGIHRRVLAPVVRVVQHVAKEARVVAATGTDHSADLSAKSSISRLNTPDGPAAHPACVLFAVESVLLRQLSGCGAAKPRLLRYVTKKARLGR